MTSRLKMRGQKLIRRKMFLNLNHYIKAPKSIVKKKSYDIIKTRIIVFTKTEDEYYGTY